MAVTRARRLNAVSADAVAQRSLRLGPHPPALVGQREHLGGVEDQRHPNRPRGEPLGVRSAHGSRKRRRRRSGPGCVADAPDWAAASPFSCSAIARMRESQSASAVFILAASSSVPRTVRRPLSPPASLLHLPGPIWALHPDAPAPSAPIVSWLNTSAACLGTQGLPQMTQRPVTAYAAAPQRTQ